MTSIVSPIEQILARVEQELQAVAVAVEGGDIQDLGRASETLRQAAVDFAGLLGGRTVAELPGDALRRVRLQRIADGLAIQREGLIRRLAAVQRTLQVLMPGAAEPAGGVYGQPGLAQPGRFGGGGMRRAMV